MTNVEFERAVTLDLTLANLVNAARLAAYEKAGPDATEDQLDATLIEIMKAPDGFDKGEALLSAVADAEKAVETLKKCHTACGSRHDLAGWFTEKFGIPLK